MLGREVFDVEATASGLPYGAVLANERVGVAYLAVAPTDHLGAVLAWVIRRGVQQLRVLVDDPIAAAKLVRRGAQFSIDTTIHLVVDRTAVPVAANPVAPEPERIEASPPAEVADLIAIIGEAGLEVMTEHGVTTGELHGLELARLVDLPDQGWTLDVGIGKFDQEAGAMLRGSNSPAESLHAAVAEVAGIRGNAAFGAHALNRTARERWLRATLVADPSQVGLDNLRPVAAPDVPSGVLESVPAAALTAEAEPALVLCMAGTDLEAVSVAADLIATHRPQRVVVVTTDDVMPIVRDQFAALTTTATFARVAAPWPA